MATTVSDPVITENNRALFPSRSTKGDNSVDFVLDQDWARSAFLVSDVKLTNKRDIQNRYWSSAAAKYTDTRLGGTIGINAKPQFTPYCDIREAGRMPGRVPVSLTNTTGNHGMGGYYSEAIDDPSQTIFLTMGVPQYNSISNFISNAFNSELTSMARTGRGPSAWYTAGKVIGTVGVVTTFPFISAAVYIGKFALSLLARPSSKYYSMKPTMPMYWNVVNLLTNTWAVNRGLLPKILQSDEQQKQGKPFSIATDQGYLDMLNSLMPDVFTGSHSNGASSNTFDVYAIANRAQRIANRMIQADFERLNKGGVDTALGYVEDNLAPRPLEKSWVSNDGKTPTLAAMLDRMIKLSTFFGKQEGETEKQELNPRIDAATGKEQDPSYFSAFGDYFDAEFNDGSKFATFKVAHTGQVQESFGNAVSESEISQKLNGISSQIRSARFSFQDGNILGGALGGIVDSTIGAVKDLAVGALDGVLMNNIGAMLTGMAGSGYVDIPKVWQSSSATLPRSTYTLELVAPYGNIISQAQNIYIPLFMLMAAALPLSTGKQSYTSPFLVQLFDRGRCQVQLGMIESLSISRGTSNLAYDTEGHCLGMEVTFTVVDLSSIMHMPVSTGSAGYLATMDEDNILVDYLAVLAGQDIFSQTQPLTKAKLNFAKWINNKTAATSPAYISSVLHDSMTNGVLKWFFGVGPLMEAAARGNEATRG